MSRRSRTILTFSVKTPLPPGWTQKKLFEEMKLLLANKTGVFSPETQVQITAREVTYL